jgi:phage shock protein C
MSELPDRPDDRPPVKTLRRSRSQRVVAGVCGGLAEYLGVDVVLIRVAFVVLALASVGIVLYIVAWLVIPDEEPSGAVAGSAPGGRELGLGSAGLVFGVVLIAIGSILFVNLLIPSFGKYFWPLLLIAIGFAIIVQASRSRS